MIQHQGVTRLSSGLWRDGQFYSLLFLKHVVQIARLKGFMFLSAWKVTQVLYWLVKHSSVHLKGVGKKNVRSAGPTSPEPPALRWHGTCLPRDSVQGRDWVCGTSSSLLVEWFCGQDVHHSAFRLWTSGAPERENGFLLKAFNCFGNSCLILLCPGNFCKG